MVCLRLIALKYGGIKVSLENGMSWNRFYDGSTRGSTSGAYV